MSIPNQHAPKHTDSTGDNDENSKLPLDSDSSNSTRFEDRSKDDDDVRRQSLRPAIGAKTVSASWHKPVLASPDSSESGSPVLTLPEDESSERSGDDASASDLSWVLTPEYGSTSPSVSDGSRSESDNLNQNLDNDHYVDQTLVQFLPDELLEPIIFADNHWREGIDLSHCHAFARPIWDIDADEKPLLPAYTHWIDVDPNNDWHLDQFLPLLSPPYSVLTGFSPSYSTDVCDTEQVLAETSSFDADSRRGKRRKQSGLDIARNAKRTSGRSGLKRRPGEPDKVDQRRPATRHKGTSTTVSSVGKEITQSSRRSTRRRGNRPGLRDNRDESSEGEISISSPLTNIPESIQEERRGRYLIIGGRHPDGRARSPQWVQSREVDVELIEEWNDGRHG